MPNGFKIVSSRLFVPYMRIQTCISCSTSKVFTISEGNMLAIGAFVTFSQPKIDNVNGVFGLLT
mgnify:CR=1 FL=1